EAWRATGVRDAGGLRGALVGPDRQPGPGDREGAPLSRAVRPLGPAPARRRRLAHRRAAPGQPRTVPVRHRPGAAARDPRPSLGLGRRPDRRRYSARPGRRRYRLRRKPRMTTTPLTVLDLVP